MFKSKKIVHFGTNKIHKKKRFFERHEIGKGLEKLMSKKAKK